MSYICGNDESFDLFYHKGKDNFFKIVDNWKKIHNVENEPLTYEMFMIINSEGVPSMDDDCKDFWDKMKDEQNFLLLDFIESNDFRYFVDF